jgi:hypothetical protein
MRFAGALSLVLATSMVAPLASAQSDVPTDAYRQHMDVGVQFYEQKNYSAAIAEFQEAYKARPKASPLVNEALCYKATFAYTKAIRALETALEKHSDTMDENDKKAAQTEIDVLRAVLSYVTFKITPAGAAVQVDGETYADAPAGKVVPLDPGPRSIRVVAEGYAPVDQIVTLASGPRELVYPLHPNMGFVKIKAVDAKYAIAIDQRALAYGEWTGLLAPGSHIVEMYLPGSPTPPYRVRVDVEVGQSYEITPGKGGVPIMGNGLPVTPPPLPPPPRPPAKPITGPFALASISLFGPTEQPSAFNGENVSPGVAAGLRVGYRVNTPVSFDAMFEYSNILVQKQAFEGVNYNLEMVHGGLNMRLQTPGKLGRFYGSFGGGIVYESLDFSYKAPGTLTQCTTPAAPTERTKSCTDVDGIDGYFLIEGGLQLTFGNILVDLALGTYVQSVRGFGASTYGDWLPVLEGGLRVGYAAW